MQWQELSEDRIVGLFGVGATAPGSPLQYAPLIEELYPFIWPAVMANVEQFAKDVAAAAPGAKGSTR